MIWRYEFDMLRIWGYDFDIISYYIISLNHLGKLQQFTNLKCSAILGWFPFLTIISSEGEQWGRDQIYLESLRPLCILIINWYQYETYINGFYIYICVYTYIYHKQVVCLPFPNGWFIVLPTF